MLSLLCKICHFKLLIWVSVAKLNSFTNHYYGNRKDKIILKVSRLNFLKGIFGFNSTAAVEQYLVYLKG
jgi:hypothetical protein